MTTNPKESAKSRIAASRARILAGRKPVTAKKKVEPSGEERLLARIAASLESLKANITVNVPKQDQPDPKVTVNVPDPKVTVNIPEQVRPSVIVNVPEQKEQPAPIINVRVPAQQPPKPPIINVEPIIQTATWEELRFKIIRLNNGLMDEVVLTRVG